MRQRGPVLSGEPPDTATLRGDVLALLRRIACRLEELGPAVILGLLADYVRDAELLAYLRPEVLSVGLEVMRVLLSRAADRGEIASAGVSARVATLPVDLLRHELFISQAPVADGVLLEIVDDIYLPLVQARHGDTRSRVTAGQRAGRNKESASHQDPVSTDTL